MFCGIKDLLIYICTHRGGDTRTCRRQLIFSSLTITSFLFLKTSIAALLCLLPSFFPTHQPAYPYLPPFTFLSVPPLAAFHWENSGLVVWCHAPSWAQLHSEKPARTCLANSLSPVPPPQYYFFFPSYWQLPCSTLAKINPSSKVKTALKRALSFSLPFTDQKKGNEDWWYCCGCLITVTESIHFVKLQMLYDFGEF